MSITSPFFLRSSNGSGAMFFKVSDNQVSEICLFNDRTTYEIYPLNLQSIITRAAMSSFAEVSAQVFEEAQIKFLEQLQVQFWPVIELPPPTPKQIEQAAIVADALNVVFGSDQLPF